MFRRGVVPLGDDKQALSNALWLETEVSTPGDASPTLLAPRQSLTAAPTKPIRGAA